MKSHGWTISAIEYVREGDTDRSLDDIENYWDHDYGYDDDPRDYYDIDNDNYL